LDNHGYTVYTCGYYLWAIHIRIIKILNLHWVGETDGNRYDVIFIMVIFLKCRVGARNDKSPEAVAWIWSVVWGT